MKSKKEMIKRFKEMKTIRNKCQKSPFDRTIVIKAKNISKKTQTTDILSLLMKQNPNIELKTTGSISYNCLLSSVSTRSLNVTTLKMRIENINSKQLNKEIRIIQSHGGGSSYEYTFTFKDMYDKDANSPRILVWSYFELEFDGFNYISCDILPGNEITFIMTIKPKKHK